MDGMVVRDHPLSTGGRGEISVSGTIRFPRPVNVVGEICVSTFEPLSVAPLTAFGVFTACTTDGSNPPLPPNETFAQGSLSGPPNQVLIRNGLTSVTYELDVENGRAHFIVNLFLWPNTLARNP